MHTASKQWHRMPAEKMRHLALQCAMFNTLYSSTNQQLFEKNLCNQSSHYESYGQFLLRIKAIHMYIAKLALFVVNKDEWDTKEGIAEYIL